MRLLRRDQRTITLRERIEGKEPDGTSYEDWSAEGIPLRGSIQPASGKVISEQYGDRIGNILMLYVERSAFTQQLLLDYHTEQKTYGACVYVPDTASKPDYKVLAIREWRHIVIDLERVNK